MKNSDKYVYFTMLPTYVKQVMNRLWIAYILVDNLWISYAYKPPFDKNAVERNKGLYTTLESVQSAHASDFCTSKNNLWITITK